MREPTRIERDQQKRYPGLTVRHDGDAVVVHVPMRLHRRKGRQMLLAADGSDLEPDRKLNRPLAQAVATAYRWQQELESGKYAGIADLAHAHGVDRAYARRLLALTSLAPDIVQAILASDEPDGMSLEKLRRDLPLSWDEQRERWR